MQCGLEPIWISLQVMFWSSLLLIVLGLPLAWLLSRRSWFGQGALEILVTLPLVFPPIAIGFFLLLLLGRDGWLNHWLPDGFQVELVFSFAALLLASVIAGLPLMIKPIQAAWQNETHSLVEAAYGLGKPPLVTFWRVTLPSIAPAVAAGLTLGVGRGMGEVGMSLMLGGNLVGQTDTLSLAIYNSVMDGDFACAMQFTWILAGIALTLFFVLRRLGRRNY
ncbi:molybdenum ABC transporter permease subunit [Thiosulfatimonas sediminis]|uniref:Molybdenum ABC transporter permease subunit n=1 Tax=Thiosulfatimonas sediminis TaxID=2675054 RepID=A0A6F8PWP0_9GAMM|nr:ABC transporter permease subunit [Thiosulfatimonas sediminis]BBP46541.1 molybdenum ABC transporter permease subunit [Thiosulfatimonas sediminis]